MVSRIAWIVLAALVAGGCGAESGRPGVPDEAEPSWRPMFDGDSLDGWRPTPFGGEGEVWIEDGAVHLGTGQPLTGITWSGDFPHDGYELRLEAARLQGTDFFCGLTFPIGATHATLVVGGWGGSLVGLSCLDGADASDNGTATWRTFEPGRLYEVRLHVAPGRVRAWIDDEPVVDVATTGREISLRPEVRPSRPLGIASFVTAARIQDVAWRPAR